MRTVRDRGPYGVSASSNNRAGAVILLAVALSAGALFGQGHTLWQDGGVQLCGTSADNPVLATSDSAGGAIVVWPDARNSPEGVYAQRVDANGVPLWTENGVLLCDSTGQLVNFAATDDGRGGAIAVWAPYRLPFAVQRVSADGVPLWGSDGFMLRPRLDSLGELPALVSDDRGGAIVVWNASPLYGNVDTLIACRVDSSGTKQWETVVRIDTMPDQPFLCPDGLGGVIITWSERNLGQVRVQRVDSTGAITWGPAGVLACTLSTSQGARPCVSAGGSCFVLGFYARTGGIWQTRAQVLDLAGNRRWGLVGVPVTSTSISSLGGVVLPADDHRQSIWLWFENRTGTNDIFAQKLDSLGIRCWDTTGVWVGTTDFDNGYPFSATIDGRGGAIAAWPLYRSGLNWDLYAQHVDSAGHLCWSDTGLAVCLDPNRQKWTPANVTDADGGATISWLDDRGIYSQRVADGAGVTEAPNAEVQATNTGPTVVRGVLVLDAVGSRQQAVDRAELLDAAGRKVAVLHKGANDVGALAPGVYFVREEPQAASHKLFAKVVVTR